MDALQLQLINEIRTLNSQGSSVKLQYNYPDLQDTVDAASAPSSVPADIASNTSVANSQAQPLSNSRTVSQPPRSLNPNPNSSYGQARPTVSRAYNPTTGELETVVNSGTGTVAETTPSYMNNVPRENPTQALQRSLGVAEQATVAESGTVTPVVTATERVAVMDVAESGLIPKIAINTASTVSKVATAAETAATAATAVEATEGLVGASIALDAGGAIATGLGGLGLGVASVLALPEVAAALTLVQVAAAAVVLYQFAKDFFFPPNSSSPVPPSNGVNKSSTPLATHPVTPVSSYGYPNQAKTYGLYIDETNNGRQDFGVLGFRQGSFYIKDYLDENRNVSNALFGTAVLLNGDTQTGYQGVYNVLNFRVRDNLGQIIQPNPPAISPNDPTYYKPLPASAIDYSQSFPYRPTVNVSERAGLPVVAAPLLSNSPPNIATPSNNPIAPPAPVAPFPKSPAPIPVQPSPLADSNPAYAQKPAHSNTVPTHSDDPNHPLIVNGMIMPYISPAYESPAFASPAHVIEAQVNPAQVNPAYESGKGIRVANSPVNQNSQVQSEPVIKEGDKPNTQLISTSTTPQKQNNLTTDTLPVSVPTPVQSTPNTPNEGTTNDTAKLLFALTGLGIATGAVLTGIDYLKNLNDQINQQTLPTAQQTNAATGACTALNNASCTSGLANSIVTPINQNAAANQAANDGKFAELLGILNPFIAFITNILNATIIPAINSIKGMLESQWVANALAVVNFATNTHNALMLSQNVAITLGTVIDQTFGFFGLTWKDKDGASHGVTDVIGHNTQALITNLIGAQRVAELETDWKIFNRIYQTGMNVSSTVQTMIDPVAMQLQNTGLNVSNIGNALRDNRVVSPKSYPHMADDPASNRAFSTDRFAQFTATVQNVETKVQHLAAVTGTVQSTAQSVTMLQTEFKTISDAIDTNSKTDVALKRQINEQVARQAKISEVTLASKTEDIKAP